MQPPVWGLALAGLWASRKNRNFAGNNISLYLHTYQSVGSSWAQLEKWWNHIFLIKELAEYAVIQAHFVAFLAVSLQGTPGQIKAASSGTALPCPIGLLEGLNRSNVARHSPGLCTHGGHLWGHDPSFTTHRKSAHRSRTLHFSLQAQDAPE